MDIHEGDDVHTGVTVILPRGAKETSYIPCYAGVHEMNGIGEWTGVHQIREWGFTRAVRIQPGGFAGFPHPVRPRLRPQPN